ncbi:YDG domain-containing protein [Selenomonas ruminantium]|nr:YDG domain-containing protein [Selenomonas ruminantium]
MVDLRNQIGGAITGNGTSTNAYSENLTAVATFAEWGDSISPDGQSRTAVWRIYDGTTTPLLTAFMTRKDNIEAKEYDGTADVGNNIIASTKTSTQAEGINWVNNVSMITPKTLTISNVTKVYDGNTAVSLSLSNVEGIVEADKTALSLSSTATAAYDNKNVGTGKTVLTAASPSPGTRPRTTPLPQQEASIPAVSPPPRSPLRPMITPHTPVKGLTLSTYFDASWVKAEKSGSNATTLKGWGFGLTYAQPNDWFARIDYARRIGFADNLSRDAESRSRIWFMVGKVF